MWAEVNVRHRRPMNRNHRLKRFTMCLIFINKSLFVFDVAPSICSHRLFRRGTSVFLNIAHPQLCSPHGTRLQCVFAVNLSRYTHASPRQGFCPPPPPPLLCECCSVHASERVRSRSFCSVSLLSVFVLCCLSAFFRTDYCSGVGN